MLEKLVRSCKVCGDEQIFSVRSLRERKGKNFFVYLCEGCEREYIERLVPGQAQDAPKVEFMPVLFEVIG